MPNYFGYSDPLADPFGSSNPFMPRRQPASAALPVPTPEEEQSLLGSVMEEGGGVWVLPLAEAIEACRTGAIPDMKTEIALLRLADHLAYIPALGRFVDELPEDLRAAWSPLGTERARP